MESSYIYDQGDFGDAVQSTILNLNYRFALFCLGVFTLETIIIKVSFIHTVGNVNDR